MSVELLQRIEQSKKQAIEKGQVIELRKTDVTKEHLGVASAKTQFAYTWYQTPAKVGIEIPFVIDNKDDLKVKFQKEHVSIEFPIKGGGDYHLNLELFKQIIPQRSKKIHRLDSIEIVMEKKEQNANWLAIRKDGKNIPEATEKEQASYPSSSKTKRNWDKIDKEIGIDIEKHGEEYGEDVGMGFFKQIFSNGDPEKRKAMIKSYQTSGGTVLSTDWNDVSKKDYEGKDRPSPPKGQEWRKSQF